MVRLCYACTALGLISCQKMSLLNADPKGLAFCVVIQGAERTACHPFRISRAAHRRLSAPDDRCFNRRGPFLQPPNNAKS